MFQLVRLLKLIVVLLRDVVPTLQAILTSVRVIAKNTQPPPEPVPTSIKWRVGIPREE